MTNLKILSSPHIRDSKTINSIMRDVIFALTPALLGSLLFFSYRALVIMLISIISCVGFEYLYNRLLNKQQTISNLSCVVTGILLGFNIPVTAPVWLAVIGSAFAIIVVKMLFGGISKNITNPAASGTALLLAFFTNYMTRYVNPNGALDHTVNTLPIFRNVDKDLAFVKTSLSYLKDRDANVLKSVPITADFIGTTAGCIGTTSAILLIIGGCYLIYKRVITWHIPTSFILTVALLTFIFPTFDGISRTQFVMYNLFGGGLMLGAIFMATDYSTSPVTPLGRIIYGIGCGVLTVVIRYFSIYSDGVIFAILIMNFFTLFIDRHTIPTSFGKKNMLARVLERFKKGGERK